MRLRPGLLLGLLLGLPLGAVACGPPAPPEFTTPPQPIAMQAMDPQTVTADDGVAADFADPAGRRRRIEAALPALKARWQAMHSALGSAGFAAALVVDDEVVAADHHGAASPDSRYMVGDLERAFDAMAVMSLRDEGRVELSAPAARYLPTLARMRYRSRDSRPFTVAQLLSHTAGLPDIAPVPDAELHQVVLTRVPGGEPVASRLGDALVRRVIAAAAGVDRDRFIAEKVLAPLDIDAEIDANGRMTATLAGMARFAAWQLAAEPARGDAEDAVVRRASRREAQRLQAFARVTRVGDDVLARGHGLGFEVGQTCQLDHVVWQRSDGPNALAMVLLPRHGIAMVAAADGPGALLGDSLRALDAFVVEGELPQRSSAPSAQQQAAVEAIGELLDKGNMNQPAFIERFTASLRQELTIQALRAEVADIRSKHGACRLDRFVSITADRALARFACRNDAPLTVSLALAGGQIDQLSMSFGEPSVTESSPRCR